MPHHRVPPTRRRLAVATAVLVLGSGADVACVGDDPVGSGSPDAPGGPDAGPPTDGGPEIDAADASPAERFCATHAGLFCADFDGEGPVDRDWSRTRKLGSGSFAYSNVFYASPPRGATAHLDAILGTGTPPNSVSAQFERDLPIDGATHLHLEAALRIDVPNILPARAQLQYVAMYFGPSPIGSISLVFDAALKWIVYVSRYAYGPADAGVAGNDEVITLEDRFPTARMVSAKLDVFLGSPTRIRFEADGVVTEQTSVAATEIAGRGPNTWTAKVGPLQTRGDSPATDVTIDNVLATKE